MGELCELCELCERCELGGEEASVAEERVEIAGGRCGVWA